MSRMTDDRPRSFFGESADIWGNNWTPEEINDANFGFRIPEGATIERVDVQLSNDALRVVTVYRNEPNARARIIHHE